MYSELTQSVVPASVSNYTQGRRGYSICKFTVHHMAGVLTGDQCAKLFQREGRQASANYCIGNDGSLTCSVEEENRAWTSSSAWNDCQAITVEVSNCEYGGDWKISDEAWNTLVNLAEDICRRYNFRLEYDGTKNGSLTTHDMYANTNCPGPTLKARLPELARIVNERLDGTHETEKQEEIPEFITVTNVHGVQEYINTKYGFGIVEDNIAGKQTKSAVAKALQLELYTNYGKNIVIDRNSRQSNNKCMCKYNERCK